MDVSLKFILIYITILTCTYRTETNKLIISWLQNKSIKLLNSKYHGLLRIKPMDFQLKIIWLPRAYAKQRKSNKNK